MIEEYLDASINGRWQKWFDRKANQKIRFGKKLTGENQLIENVTRPNSLFLSAAAQNNHEMLSPLFQWLTTQIKVLNTERRSLDQETSKACALDHAIKSRVLDLMASADLGVVDFELKEQTIPDHERSKEVAESVRSFLNAIVKSSPTGTVDPQWAEGKMETTVLYHKAPDGQQIPLNVHQESDGTVAYFGLLGPCLKALRSGGLVCIDELNASLHSLLAIQLVHLFNKQLTNPGHAQLIFNSHDTNLLQRSILRRDQIWFTEKDHEGATQLVSVDRFQNKAAPGPRARILTRPIWGRSVHRSQRLCSSRNRGGGLKGWRRGGIQRSKATLDVRPRIVIFCEGQVTEREYIEGLRKQEQINLAQVIVAKETGTPKTLVEQAKKY